MRKNIEPGDTVELTIKGTVLTFDAGQQRMGLSKVANIDLGYKIFVEDEETDCTSLIWIGMPGDTTGCASDKHSIKVITKTPPVEVGDLWTDGNGTIYYVLQGTNDSLPTFRRAGSPENKLSVKAFFQRHSNASLEYRLSNHCVKA